ncbi:LLM class flavin-dependent oxidoreductase [Sinomonas sp. ASV322]|uniref:LLM class flavin-dependent oxidoreductase n=1 Tax=Sinomonas sp. ASV322 TaxID=3041920 RepID=UPI0027DB9059|nr:LLM class flavin-dependent oxidoreductase [Sinomonas sp. ASV322]MDQ4504182.1 LLM class flavin-dependent oxidoreductase [Sinomonas sp. ASV322]
MTRPNGLIGLDLDDAHPSGWRFAAAPPSSAFSPERSLRRVLDAESAGFHFATFSDPTPARGADEHGRLDAVQRAAHAAPLTRTIALVPEVEATSTEPFHVSTQLASLDYVSYGRAGWLVAVDGSAPRHAAVGRGPLAADDAFVEAADAVEVARRLWDTWEDNAEIRDVAAGRYLDASRVHYAEFRGRSFSIKGPSIIPRPPQGQLPVFAPYGQVPPAQADVLLTTAPAWDLLLAEAALVRDENPERLVVAELDLVLDARGQAGGERLAALDATSSWQSPHALFAGGPAELADYLGELLRVADGVRLHPAVVDVDLPELAQLVLPELRRRGLLAPTVPDTSLRYRLGLRRPPSRYAAGPLPVYPAPTADSTI